MNSRYGDSNAAFGSVDSRNQTDNSYDATEKYPPICSMIKRSVRRQYANRGQILKDRLPVLKWLPKYRLSYFIFDFIAGLTVGLTAIPQNMANAIVAGLPPQYGLYSGFIGSFVYLFFGSCKDVTTGPTAILALVILPYVKENYDFGIFMTFLNGVLIFLFGMLNLGFVVQFISIPVTVGFTIAAAMTIGSTQVKGLFGIKGSTNSFIEARVGVFSHITEIKPWDTLLGVATICFLFALRTIKFKKNSREVVGESLWWNECKKFMSLGRNAFVVIFGTVLAYTLHLYDCNPFTLTGSVKDGLPEVKWPPFQTTIGNETLYFTDMISHVGSSIIALPLVSMLESVAITKAFSKGKTIDATQEMLAIGLCNVLGSFFQSLPVTSSLTRTAVNNASGVRTTLGGIVTGCLVLLSLVYMTRIFGFIPKTSLAGVIICAMICMVDIKEIREIWRSRRLDIIPLLVTLLASLIYSIDIGILVGIAINLAFVLYNVSRPTIHYYSRSVLDQELLIVTPDQSLSFSSADHCKYKVLKYVARSNPGTVIIDGRFIRQIDATVAKSICGVVEDLYLLGKAVYFWQWDKEPMSVICRLKPSMAILFNVARTEDELVTSVHIKNRDSIPSTIQI